MSRLTLRGRVTLAAVGVLAVAFLAIGLAFNVLLASRLHADASNILRGRATAQIATLDLSGGHVRVEEAANDAALDRDAWVYSGNRLIEGPTATPPGLQSDVSRLVSTGRPGEETVGTTRLRAVPVSARGRRVGSVVVAVSLVPYQHTRRIALVGTAILSALFLLAALVAVRLALRAALRPVAEMTERAADWSEHDLHRRFALGEPRDELTALAATFDGLLRRIEAVVRHEQRFSAEMAHELRTPLAGVRADVELELRRTDLPASTREALDRMLAAAARMETVIETLLSSARMADGGPTDSCDPLPALREAVMAVSGAAEAREVRVEVATPPEPLTVDAAPEVVMQAVFPLLENGVRHANSKVEISLARHNGDVKISVLDDGPGVPGDALDEVFAPGVSSTGGAGLGLPLSRRLARSCGGDVRAAPAGDGALFELHLPGGSS